MHLVPNYFSTLSLKMSPRSKVKLDFVFMGVFGDSVRWWDEEGKTMIYVAGFVDSDAGVEGTVFETYGRVGCWRWKVLGLDWRRKLATLKSAISEYSNVFTDLVMGISIGAEDLYRNSTTAPG